MFSMPETSVHHQQTNIQLCTGRMPFLSPNQQCHSTEAKGEDGKCLPAMVDRESTSPSISCSCRLWLKCWHSNSDLRDRTLDVDDIHCRPTFCETLHKQDLYSFLHWTGKHRWAQAEKFRPSLPTPLRNWLQSDPVSSTDCPVQDYSAPSSHKSEWWGGHNDSQKFIHHHYLRCCKGIYPWKTQSQPKAKNSVGQSSCWQLTLHVNSLSWMPDKPQQKMKKCSERRKHCELAAVRRSQNFLPRHRPLLGGAGRPKFNQLKVVTTFPYRPSLVRIDACNFK